jgi:hypothetical protein
MLGLSRNDFLTRNNLETSIAKIAVVKIQSNNCHQMKSSSNQISFLSA